MFKVGIGDAVARRPKETRTRTDRKMQHNEFVINASSFIGHLYCSTFRQKGKDFFEKRERYWTALETSVLEKLPPEDSLGAILDEYKKDKENLSKDDLCRLVSIIFSDIIKGYSQSELEPILKNFYDELKSLGQKNVESEIESQRNSLSQTLKK